MATVGYPWRMLNTVRTITTGQVQEFSEAFNGTSLSATDWSSTPSWTLYGQTSQGNPTIANGLAQVRADIYNETRCALLVDKNISTESYREVSLGNWYTVSGNAAMAFLMLDMDDSSPDPDVGGIMLNSEYHVQGDNGGVSYLTLTVDGVVVATKSYSTRPPGGTWTLKLSVDGSNVVRGYWSSPAVPDITYSLGTHTATGTRAGFALRASIPGQLITAASFLLRYFDSAGSLPATALVGSNNGIVYYESTNGNMVQVNSDLTTLTDEWISATNRLHQLYIADHGVKSTNTADSATTSVSTLTDTSADFTTDGVDADDDMLEITNTDQVVATVEQTGTWPIASFTGTTITVTGTLGTGTAVSYRVMRAPKVFDSEELTLTRLTASAGFVPPDCKIAAIFGDRLYLAGDANLPEALYASKIGDPTDFDYGTNLINEAFVYDPARVAGAPYIGDAVTALIPHLDDYLIIGCKRSIWIQRGDPALGAPPEAISREVGILKQSAWCYTPDNTIVAMTQDGLYIIEATPASKPYRVSRDRMPQELVNIDTNTTDVLVEYDTLRNGINIFVTPRNPGPTQHFWFGWQMKEFSPEGYNSDFEPTAITSHSLSAIGPRRVILGCRDGYLRVHEDSAHTDDGENFQSNVLIGPVMLGGDGYHEGMIREVVGQLATDSGPVTMKIRVGDSVESAYNAASRVSYVMSAGKNRTWRPNLRGNACFIELFSEGGEAWAFEQLSIVRERLGKQRLLA
jgi:hypothetical protein